jgi:hypothetical protein
MSAFSLATILEDAEVSQTEPGGMSNVSFCCRMWILDDLPWKKRTVIRSHWHLEVSFCLSWRILNVRSCQMLFSYEARRFLVLSAAFLCSFGFDVDLKQSHIHCRHIYIYLYIYSKYSKCCDPKEINNQRNPQLRKPFCGQWRLVFYKSAGLVSLSQRRMVWGSKKFLKQLSGLISTRGSFMAGTSCQQSDTVIVLLPRSVALWNTMGILLTLLRFQAWSWYNMVQWCFDSS